MSRRCEICGKGPTAGRSIAQRGKAKKHGGVGRRTLRVTKRRFLVNIQKVRVKVGKTVKSMMVCTRCIKSDKIKKA